MLFPVELEDAALCLSGKVSWPRNIFWMKPLAAKISYNFIYAKTVSC